MRRGTVRLGLAAAFLSSVAWPVYAAADGASDPVSAKPAAQLATAPVAPKAAPMAENPPTEVQGILVTGSRIRHKEIESASPMEIFTREDAELSGVTDVAEALQSSNLANGVQSNGQLSGYVVTGGAGVRAFDLHGVGAERTLILLNGRRLGPAGVGGTVGPVDLNVIPNPVWERVEILKDGASSIYGSDAIAGVANIITRTRFEGVELSAGLHQGARDGGGSSSYDILLGKVADRGYLNASLSYDRQEALRLRQRSYLSCAESYIFDPTTGQRADIPGVNGKPKCFNLLNNVWNSTYYGGFFQYDPSGTAYAYPAAALGLRGSLPDWVRGGRSGRPTTYPYQNYTSPLYDNATAISPASNATLFIQGAYNLAPKIESYTEVLLTERKSSQFGAGQLFPYIDPTNPNNTAAVGLQNASGGLDPGYVRPVIAYPSRQQQTVDYTRLVAGLRGDLPNFASLTDWQYDVYAAYSRSVGKQSQNFIYNDRVNATTGPDVACDPSQITISGPTGCVSIPWLDPKVLSGQFTPEQSAFLFGQESGRTIYDQATVVAEASGDVLTLPAGKLAASVGASFRRDIINDQPGLNARNYNYWGYSTAGATHGSDSVNEVYGEVEAPLVRGQPFVDKFTINLSGRYVDYKSAGDYGIYKIGAFWEVTPELKFRATHGTSIRAPALYEQFLANQTSYLNITDPCTKWADSSSPKIQANCAAAGIPPDYPGAQASSQITQGGGSKLRAESSKESTLGIILTPKFANLSVAVDWTQLTIVNQVSSYGAQSIVNACYSGYFAYPSTFCTYITRDPSTHDIVNVDDFFKNIQQQKYAGIDLTVKYRSSPISYAGKEIGRLGVNLYSTWNTTSKEKIVAQLTQNSLGLLDTPQFKASLDADLKRGDITYYWKLDFIGRQSDVSSNGGPIQKFGPLGTLVRYKYYVESMISNTASIQWKKQNWRFEAGIENLFDEHPPVLSTGEFRIGVSALNEYDIIGRRYFATVRRNF